jgi:hypothetical protein
MVEGSCPTRLALVPLKPFILPVLSQRIRGESILSHMLCVEGQGMPPSAYKSQIASTSIIWLYRNANYSLKSSVTYSAVSSLLSKGLALQRSYSVETVEEREH